MACDICGKVGTVLEELLPAYQTQEIKAICPECCREVNKKLHSLRRVTQGILKAWLARYMEQSKESFTKKRGL